MEMDNVMVVFNRHHNTSLIRSIARVRDRAVIIYDQITIKLELDDDKLTEEVHDPGFGITRDTFDTLSDYELHLQRMIN